MQAKMALSKMQMGLTIQQAIGGTQITTLRRRDEDVTLLCMGTLVATVCESLNVGKSMSTLQAYEAACLLVGKFWMLKLEEFVYIFRQGKTGAYGVTYDRVDIQILCEWCEKYWSGEERAKHLEEYHRKYKLNEKEPISLEMAKHLENVFQKIEPRQVAQPIETKQSTFEEWLDMFKAKAETYTIAELRAWNAYGKDKGIKDVVAITDTILGDYETGKRTYMAA